MEINIFEIKTVIRSILISSPVVLNVFELNNDFKEQEGIEIPYKKLGYNSLWKFLKSIPDVLQVEGNSHYSGVILVESAKSSHVNELVLKQKLPKKPGAFHSNYNAPARKKKHNYHVPKPPTKEIRNKSPIQEVVTKPDDGYSSQKSSSDKSNTRNKNEDVPEEIIIQSKEINKVCENRNLIIDSTKPSQRLDSENNNSVNSLKNENKENILGSETVIVESTKLLRRINYKDDSNNIDDSLNDDDFLNVDVSLKVSEKQIKTEYWRGGNTGNLNQNKNIDKYSNDIGTFHSFEKCVNSNSSRTSLGASNNNRYDLNCSWPIKKSKQKNKEKNCMTKTISSSVIKNSRNKTTNCKTQRQLQNFIPTKIQDNLQNLISDFPEGLWCTELPTVYRNFIGEDLCFEELGYRCLSHLCFDLGNIFHCVKESLCDYKLYDARKSLPEVKYLLEQSTPSQSNSNSSATDLPPAIPEISWKGFDPFLPKDVVKLGHTLGRIQVADLFEAGQQINVVVAEIYDISKFWIYLDDTQLDRLMSEMQGFYAINKGYSVPKSLLAEGLHCVVLYLDKFHRAVILNVMADEDNLRVFYFDYGTVGTSPKSDVWFLTLEFSELPAQAIRARLSDVYPQYEGITWSPLAIYDFKKYTCMKKLTAEIVRVDKHKNLLDIKLKNRLSSYISEILVDRNYAIFINHTQKKHIEDPNCKSRVRYIHLFPTFEEIENWVVPSMEEAADFLNTSVTADFLYSQYFTRHVDTDLINSIDEKMKTTSRKRKSLLKYIDPEELLSMHSVEEMNKIAYSDFYDPYVTETRNYTEENSVDEAVCEVQDSKNESWSIEDDETLARILRQTRMKPLYSFEDIEAQEEADNSEGKLSSDYVKNSLHITSQCNNKKGTEVPRESDSSGSSMKMKSPLWPRFRGKGSREVSNYLELEKYLSEEDSSKKSTPKLDSDNGYLSPINSSTNLLLGSDFEQSVLDLAKSRKQSLLTESITSSMEKCTLVNPLDLPIPNNVNNSLICDLIQFDVEDSMTAAATNSRPEEIFRCNSIKPIFNEGSDLSDADDEDSDSKQNNSNNPHKCSRSKPFLKKFLDKTTVSNTALADNNCYASNSTQIPDQSLLRRNISNVGHISKNKNIREIPDIKNITQFANEKDQDLAQKVYKNTDKNKGILLEFFKSTRQKIHNKEERETAVSDINLIKRNSDMHECPKTPQEANDEEYLPSIPGSRNYIHANDSGQSDFKYNVKAAAFEPRSNSTIGRNDKRNLIDVYDSILGQSSNSNNMYYSCESEQSSVPDSSTEMSCDFKILSNNVNLTDKDKIFLEEFDIITNSSTLDPTSDLKSEALESSLNIISGEWTSLENSTLQHLIPNGDSDMDCGISSNSEIIEDSNINLTKDNRSEISHNPNIGDNGGGFPVTPVIENPQFSYSSNNMPQPQIVARRPPPGFHPIPAYRYTRVAGSNGIQYVNGFVAPNLPLPSLSIQHPEMLNGMPQYPCPYPIVVLNYNFLPQMNQNGNS